MVLKQMLPKDLEVDTEYKVTDKTRYLANIVVKLDPLYV